MLADVEKLDCFLDQIFRDTDLRISVKTRIGIERPGRRVYADEDL